MVECYFSDYECVLRLTKQRLPEGGHYIEVPGGSYNNGNLIMRRGEHAAGFWKAAILCVGFFVVLTSLLIYNLTVNNSQHTFAGRCCLDMVKISCDKTVRSVSFPFESLINTLSQST
jgi:ABC-type Fe3+ transport system permease subunit